jgi:predicted amidohydrolase
MESIKISTAQFENRSGDKVYNLSVIDKLSQKAAKEGANMIAFHECSITGYSFARHLSKEQMLELAEYIPEGESVQQLTAIARKNNIAILAGLFEKDKEQ